MAKTLLFLRICREPDEDTTTTTPIGTMSTTTKSDLLCPASTVPQHLRNLTYDIFEFFFCQVCIFTTYHNLSQRRDNLWHFPVSSQKQGFSFDDTRRIFTWYPYCTYTACSHRVHVEYVRKCQMATSSPPVCRLSFLRHFFCHFLSR